ncbi:MAG: sulfotransferase [Candidatus Heimdallarchaeota archaeon]
MKTVVPLCVLRSGSTVLSGVLHYLGVSMGKKSDLIKGQHVNKYGCFENQDFLRLSHRILYDAGSSGIYFDYPSENKIKQSVVKNWVRAQETITRNRREPYWGWKDPSSFHIIHYLDNLLEDPHYIILKRDVKQIAKSVMKISVQTNFYSSFKHELGLFDNYVYRVYLVIRLLSKYFATGRQLENEEFLEQIIAKSYLKMEKFTRNKKCLVITFDDLINKSEKTIKQITKFLEMKRNTDTFEKALNFVHPELVNFKKSNQ